MRGWIQGKRIIVTGGAGFVGLNLVKRLRSEGAVITVPVRRNHPPNQPGVEFRAVDLLDLEAVLQLVRDVRPDSIIHSAAAGYHPIAPKDRIDSLAVATLGTAHLLEAALECGINRALYLGGSTVYPMQPHAMQESQAPDPVTFRGAGKASGSIIWRQFAKATGLRAAELRLFSVYGPHEAETRFIPKLLRAAWDEVPFPLLRGPRHDFIYAEDVADACVRALEQPLPAGEIVNIGTGIQSSNEEVVALVEQVTGRRVRIVEGEFPRRAWDSEAWRADTTRAENLLGWRAATRLHDGLQQTFEWLRTERWPVCSS